MLVSKEDWPEIKKDIEEHGVSRISINDDRTIVRIATNSHNGYNFPVKFIRKLVKDGEMPASVLAQLGKG